MVFFKKNNQHNKNEKDQRFYDLKFNPDKSTIVLKNKRKDLVFNLQNLKYFWYKFRNKIILGFVFLIIISFIFNYFFFSHAEILEFYPSSCLGGWQNPQNAQGKPELEPNAKSEDFNENNSAILKNIISEIYCGNFKGDVLENTIPKKAFLKFSWLIQEGEKNENIILNTSSTSDENLIETSTLIQIINLSSTTQTTTEEEMPSDLDNSSSTNLENTNTSTLNLDNQSSTNNNLESQIIPESLEQTPQIESSTTNNSTTPESSNLNSSFWNKLFKIVFAQNFESSSQQVNQNVSDSEIDLNNSLNSSSVDVLNLDDSTNTAISSTDSNLIENTSTLNLNIVSSTDDIFELFYTFDGTFWQSLGRVNFSNWKDLKIEIPDFDWSKLDKLQIKIQSISPKEYNLTAYLDGMILEVEYETKQNLDENTNLAQIDQSLVDNNLGQNNSSTDSMNLNNNINEESSSTNSGEQQNSEEYSMENNPLNQPNLNTTPLTKRKIQSNIIISKNSNILCNSIPQSINISNQNNINLKLLAENLKLGTKIEIGSLPDGIDIKFLKNNDYIINSSLENETFDLEVFNQIGSQKGNFNIPIIIYEDNNKAVICQINVINF